jgi:hypothetical protein
MLNLLLRKDRYDLKREYSLRFYNIFMLFLIFAIVIFMVLLFSVSIFVWVERNTIINQLNSVAVSIDAVEREELQSNIKKINSQINKFQQPKPAYSGFLSEILTSGPNGITISGVSFDPIMDSDEQKITIQIDALADSRRSMIEYSEALRENVLFENVNLPLSNLTRETDINFRLTMETTGLFFSSIILENNESVN